MKGALNGTYRYIVKHKLKSKLVLTIHDELILDADPREELQLIEDIPKIMSAAYPYKHLPLRISVEKSTSSWSRKRPIESTRRNSRA